MSGDEEEVSEASSRMQDRRCREDVCREWKGVVRGGLPGGWHMKGRAKHCSRMCGGRPLRRRKRHMPRLSRRLIGYRKDRHQTMTDHVSPSI